MEMQTIDATAREARVFHTLDALRGIAAVGVVVFHMGALFAPLSIPGGYLAVDLFFMMSGVVLSHAYETRFRGGMGTLAFMRARAIRLYPLYLAGLLFGIAVTLASMRGHNIQNWDAISLMQVALPAFLFAPNFSAKPVNELFPLNIPCWSLFFEIVVNFLFVISWPLLNSRRLIAVCLLAAVALAVGIAHTGSVDQGSVPSGFAAGLARTIFGFSAGVLIARRVGHAPRVENNLRVLAIVAVAALAIIGNPQGESRAMWDAACVLLVFPLVVYAGTLVDPRPRLRRIATFLGVTSYAIYVLHGPLSSVLNSANRHFALIVPPYLGIAVLALLLCGCWLIDRYFDMPLRRLLSRIVPKMRGVPVTAKTNHRGPGV